MVKQSTNKDIPKIQDFVKHAQKVEDVVDNWQHHIEERHEINAFTTLAGNKLYHIVPQEGQTFLPFSEYHGDHTMNYIICIDKENNEVFRKNIKYADMIDWKLSSSLTNSKENGKQ